MRKTDSKRGFTLIELLTVIAIITIIMSMVMVAAHNAKIKAQTGRARAEVRELVNAWRAYYTLYYDGTRAPPSFLPSFIATPQNGVEMTADNIAPLLGYDDSNNPLEREFLEFPDDTDFVDPWGNIYVMNFDFGTSITETETFKTAISFPMYQRGQLD